METILGLNSSVIFDGPWLQSTEILWEPVCKIRWTTFGVLLQNCLILETVLLLKLQRKRQFSHVSTIFWDIQKIQLLFKLAPPNISTIITKAYVQKTIKLDLAFNNVQQIFSK